MPAAALVACGGVSALRASRRVHQQRRAPLPVTATSRREAPTTLLGEAASLELGGRTIACPPMMEIWEDTDGVEDRELVCGPRGCVPVDVLVADQTGAYGWMDRFHALALHHRSVFGSRCCYCGDKAGSAEEGLPCSFEGCNCTWAFAESVWINGMDPDSAKRYFREAIDAHPENGELQAAFAIFCWLGLDDVPRAREHYERASALDPKNLNIAASRAYFEMAVARGARA